MDQNKAVEKNVKLMKAIKLEVVKKTKAYDQSEKIFDTKKAKEK